jgi:hypothetical protein
LVFPIGSAPARRIRSTRSRASSKQGSVAVERSATTASSLRAIEGLLELLIEHGRQPHARRNPAVLRDVSPGRVSAIAAEIR